MAIHAISNVCISFIMVILYFIKGYCISFLAHRWREHITCLINIIIIAYALRQIIVMVFRVWSETMRRCAGTDISFLIGGLDGGYPNSELTAVFLFLNNELEPYVLTINEKYELSNTELSRKAKIY